MSGAPGMVVPMAKKKTPKEQLPEGMSRRQAKLAARAAERAALAKDPRPFGGFAMEADLIALQEFVPSATAPLPLSVEAPRPITLVTILPGAGAGVARENDVLIALQAASRSQNPGRDLARCIQWAQGAQPGDTLSSAIADGQEPALSDLLPADATLDITEHEDFDWWLPEGQAANLSPELAASFRQANEAIIPSTQVAPELPGSAWWVDPGTKAHIRWVYPTESENSMLNALARIAARGELHLGEKTKFAGVFRTHGIVVPVFDLDRTVPAESYAEPMAVLNTALEKELSNDAPLSAEERRKLQNIKSREVTIR